jgi:hypothetical protein
LISPVASLRSKSHLLGRDDVRRVRPDSWTSAVGVSGLDAVSFFFSQKSLDKLPFAGSVCFFSQKSRGKAATYIFISMPS